MIEVEGSLGGFEEFVAAARAGVPPVVYLPVSGVPVAGRMEVELRETSDGRRALLAYTALDRLAEGCGPDQPWVLHPTARLDQMGVSFDVIFFDLAVPPQLWHQPATPAPGGEGS